MSRVFVVQRPAYYDRAKRGWVNKYDFSPAKKHGELVFVLRPGNIFRDRLEAAVQSIKEALSDFSSDDYVLAIGDPVAIAATIMVASGKTGGKVRLLKYDRLSDSYSPYEINVGNEGLVSEAG